MSVWPDKMEARQSAIDAEWAKVSREWKARNWIPSSENWDTASVALVSLGGDPNDDPGNSYGVRLTATDPDGKENDVTLSLVILQDWLKTMTKWAAYDCAGPISMKFGPKIPKE